MSKTIKQLQQEYSANEVKIQQEKHKLQRLNNRVQYYEKGGRQKRAHRLITRGAAIESVAPAAVCIGSAADRSRYGRHAHGDRGADAALP